MAVTLVGELVNTCDAITGFNTGNINGDGDDWVQGAGAVGLKASSTTAEIYTTTLGATAPYDFSSGGNESGYHIIMWFNTKTPIDTKANGGMAIIVGDGTSRGKWYVRPSGFYKGGFITRVIDSARDFNNIAAGSWSTTSNPSQLSNITQVGGGFVTTTSIMGSFNNVQLDQMTIGLGLRVDAGSTGTPNTFETVRAADEDSSFYGWWASTQGAILGKGKMFFGPATGTATSVFRDSAVAVIFADEDVASGFYEFSMRGANTEVTWDLMSINIGGTARWSLTLDSAMGDTTGGFTDTNSTLISSDVITLNANATLDGTTIISGNSLVQTGATLDSITVTEPNVATNVAYVKSDNLGLISDSTFNANSSNVGHAIEITSATGSPFTFSGNQFPGFTTTGAGSNLVASTGASNAMIYNNSGAAVTINISGGGQTPVIRNGAGATTTVNNNVSVTLTGMRDNTEVRVCAAGDPSTQLAGIESATAGTADDRSFTFSLAAATSVDIIVYNTDYILPPNNRISGFTIPSSDASLPISQVPDRNYENP